MNESLRQVILNNSKAYSRIAKEWAAKETEHEEEIFREKCRKVFIDNLRGERILDLGCGTGKDSFSFVERGYDVTAADISPEFFKTIKKRNNSIKNVSVDMTRLCFRESSFDGIYIFASFLHIPRDVSLVTMNSIAEILSPGGIIFLQHVKSEKGYSGYKVDDLLVKDNPAFCFCHTEEEITEIMNKSGLNIIDINYYDYARKSSNVREKYGLSSYQILCRKE